MQSEKAKYYVGQIVHHKLFDYRGIIVDADPSYQRTDEWYVLMAKSRPAKEQPWYQVLVDDTDYVTYVAEQNLQPDYLETPITHPKLTEYLDETDGQYYTKHEMN